MILSKEKGLLKVRLERDDVVTSLKEQMAKSYGYRKIPSMWKTMDAGRHPFK